MDGYIKLLQQCFSWLNTLPLFVFATTRRIVAAAGLGEAWVNGRRFRLLRLLGEGGYAYVYLAQELPTPSQPLVEDVLYALKKVLIHTGETRQAVENEIAVQRQLRHPNLLRLVDAQAAPHVSSTSATYAAYLVFPAYLDGTLAEELDCLKAQDKRLSPWDVLNIFGQVCLGVQHMHAAGFRHGDLKPHNILISRPQRLPSLSGSAAVAASAVALLEDAELGVTRGRYEAVLMDFGSARPKAQHITSRAEALALQEDAEAHCTATYRAPELFDVPSHGTVDTAADVWSLGCTLYHCMYGASPFQKALDESSSLALAVLSCNIPWPKQGPAYYPESLHQLVLACLQVEPVQRTSMAQLLAAVERLQRQLPPIGDPNDVSHI